MEREKELKIGEWDFLHNAYYKKCIRVGCEETYHGRLNKLFCSDKCKTKVNNDKANALRRETKDNTLKTLKAIKIIKDILGEKLDCIRIKCSDLYEMGFSFSLSTTKLKLKTSMWEWNSISTSYAFRMCSVDTVEIINVKKYK